MSTTLPRPALGLQVEYGGNYFEIIGLDHRARTFTINGFTESTPWKIDLNLDKDYKPAPTRANFELALDQWDYHYTMSDDPRIYDEGHEQQQALMKMFKQLSIPDHHLYKKLLFIMSAKS